MLDSARASDATQEVFVAAWSSRERHRPDAGTLAGWLTGIARFKVIDVLRADGRQRTPLTDPTHAREPQPDERAREMRVTHFEGRAHTQIAERCDMPLGTVRSDIRRALERMRCQLEGFDLAA